MTGPRRIQREFTPEERERWQQAVQETEAELPELLERDKRRQSACREQTVSGQLRRAIQSSGLRYDDVSRKIGVPVGRLADFMTGDAPLDSETFDKLSTLLNLQLASLP